MSHTRDLAERDSKISVLKAEVAELRRELAEARAALKLARERICTDRKALNTLSDLFQAQTDKADLCDARIIQDRTDEATFKIIDRALASRNPADGREKMSGYISADNGQGMGPTDVCEKFSCQEWRGDKLFKPRLVLRGKFWCCPLCHSSYGEHAKDGLHDLS